MQQPSAIGSIVNYQKTLAGETVPAVVGYGYGLRWSMDSRNNVNVGHSGGLPGFGSNYCFYPDRGFAIMSFANLTYAGMSALNLRVATLLLEKANLPRRMLAPSPVLAARQRAVAELIQSWDAGLADTLVAENFFLDHSREDWLQRSRAALAQIGKITAVGEIVPDNQLRGTFPIVGENGRLDVFFTLTPERTARLQELRLTVVRTSP
jgi:hypothetical protein